MKKIMMFLLLSQLIICQPSFGAETIDINKIVEAIYKAEGGIHAKKPFGILSVPCSTYEACKSVCRNTVRHSYSRWKKSNQDEDFISYISRTYAPVSGDTTGLNKNWRRNVRYFYER